MFFIGMLVFAPAVLSQDLSSYQNYESLTGDLKKLVSAHKDIAKMESIGKTLEGRDLWVVTIANQKGVQVDERPGMFIGANFEGDHLVGSKISLSVIDYLLKNYSSDEAVKKSIDEHVYYIIPRMNPDGAEKMFAGTKTGSKTNASEYDGDNDGRMDEDGPEDLNKDGLITVMRVKDENGSYLINKEEPRLLKKADPSKGEEGIYSVYIEGFDNDNDGFINEDPGGGVDLNRNFQHEYPYYQDDAGHHMISENESIALMEWIIKHRNIAIMLNFGESDNLIVSPNDKGILSSDRGIDLKNFAAASYSEAGKVGMMSTGGRGRFRGFGGMFRMGGTGRQNQQSAQTSSRYQRPARNPETTVNADDLEFFKKVGDQYKELTGIKTQPPLRDPKGAFFQYGYYQFGVLSLSTPGWGIDMPEDSTETGRRPSAGERRGSAPPSGATGRSRAAFGGRSMPGGGQAPAATPQKEGIDKEFLSWLDKNNKEGFIDWQTVSHPEFGEVEVGGFSPYAVNNPPASEVAALGEAHGKFAVWLSGLYAQVKIAKTEVIDHGGGIFRIKAEVENTGFLPTALNHGVASRSVKPTMVQLEVDPESIISGNAKTSFFQSLAGSGNREKYEWLIKGKPGDQIELKVVAQKAGSDKVKITLK
ncbi:MAG: hypothetical protein JXA03_09275 [Bacteroidales bacterium]|nr:hypothetical protein [Bacteroidales bacterium]